MDKEEQRMNKRWGTIGIWILGFLCVAMVAYATVIKDAMDYIGTHTHVGDMTRTGDTALTGALAVTGPVTSGTTIITAASATATTDNSTYYVNSTGKATCILTFPFITEAMDGWPITVKHYGNSGSTPIIATAYSTDAIESTQGTLTATTDNNIDGAGEVRVWKAHYISGASNVWQLMSEIL